jgi:hypothetical protein
MHDEKWTKVFVTGDPVEAEIIKDLLESEGIPVRMVSLKVGPYPVNIGKMGEIRLFVKNEDVEAAEIAIKDFRL